MGAGRQDYCPDCSSELKSNGCCSECGYGENGDMEDSSEDTANVETLLEIKDDLARLARKIDKLIASGD